MPNFLENLGLESFMESEESMRGLLAYIANKGKVLKGYTDDLTVFLPSGSIDFFVRAKYEDSNNQYIIEGLDTHICGREKWKVRIESDITTADTEPLIKRLLITNHKTGSGLAVVNVLNSHMLPSLMKNDVYDFQVCAFPVEIDYFQNQESYNESIPKTITGQTYGLAKGTVFPSGFFNNHDVRNKDKEVDYSSDELVLIMGEVKKVYWGSFEFEEERFHPYVLCVIDTQFGLLKIAHTVEQINEDQQEFMKPGCVVSGIFVLSADAAIGEYENEVALGEDNCLRVLRYAMCKGETERLQAVVSEDVIYESKTTNTVYNGAKDVIERIKYVHKASGKNYEADMASIDSFAEGLTDPDCAPGKRCFLLKNCDADNYESIVFIDTDDAGKIVHIITTDSPDYLFSVDEYPHPEDITDDSELPTDYREAMLLRAKLFGWIDKDFEIDDINIPEAYSDMIKKAEMIIRSISWKDTEGQQDYLRNLFGYWFTMGFQYKLYDNADVDFAGIEDDKPVFKCPDKDIILFQKIYKQGKTFFIDLKIREGVDVSSEESVNNVLNAMRFVFQLSFHCASEKLTDTLRANLAPNSFVSGESPEHTEH